MQIIQKLAKIFITAFSLVIKNNKDALKYLFTKSLKNETINFIEEQYYQNYAHIDKSIQLLKKLGLPDSVIIDVGGADGTTSKIFAIGFPEKEIYVFEPIAENFFQLESVKKNFNNLKLFKKALGRNESKVKINIATRITSSSIFNLNPDKKSAIFSKDLVQSRVEEIEITTLDIAIPHHLSIGILKLDVQGYELEVLQGADSMIPRTAIIVLEMNNHNHYSGAPKYYEIDHFLRNVNFTLFDIFPSTKDLGKLKEWDAIYLNNNFLS